MKYLIHYGGSGVGARWCVQSWNGQLGDSATLEHVGDFAQVWIETRSLCWAQENQLPGAKTAAVLVEGELTRIEDNEVRIE